MVSADLPLRSSPGATRPMPGTQREKFIGFARDEASATLLHEACRQCLPPNTPIHVATSAPRCNPQRHDDARNHPHRSLRRGSADERRDGTGRRGRARHHRAGDRRHPECQFLPHRHQGHGHQGIPAQTPLRAPWSSFSCRSSPIGNPPPLGRAAAAWWRSPARAAVSAPPRSPPTSPGSSAPAAPPHRPAGRRTPYRHRRAEFQPATNNGLTTALKSPERVDPLLLERSVRPPASACMSWPGRNRWTAISTISPAAPAAASRRCGRAITFVIVGCRRRARPLRPRPAVPDASSGSSCWTRASSPSATWKNCSRCRAAPRNRRAPLLVLNKAGTPGGLSQTAWSRSIGLRFDAVIPDLPRIVPKTTQFGTQPASLRGPFRRRSPPWPWPWARNAGRCGVEAAAF